MEAIEEIHTINKRKYSERVSATELYSVLEELLPFAQVEVNCLADDARDMKADDPDYPETAVRAQRGKEAIEWAERLIARKTATIRRKQRALREKKGQADA